MKSPLSEFLKNETLPGNTMTVTVVKRISAERYIVGDKSCLAILELQQKGKEIKVDSGVKLIKPIRVSEKTLRCNPSFLPAKTFDYEKLKPSAIEIQEIEKELEDSKDDAPLEETITLESITKMAPNTIIPKATFFVVRNSRIIQTPNGQYQICGLKDIEGQKMTINLYDKFIDKFEIGKVMTATNLKKFNLKKNGQYEPRLQTTRATKLTEASPKERDAFKSTSIADNSVEGTILGFCNINCYSSCTAHWNKIDNEGICPVCNEEPRQALFDFNAELILQIGDDEDQIKTFLIFRRAASMITTESTEDAIEEKLAEYSGVKCRVDFDDENDPEKRVILKRLVTF